MGDFKSREPSIFDTQQEYLRLKTRSDKKFEAFARQPNYKYNLVDVNMEAKERAEAVLRNWKHLGQLLKACRNEAVQTWLTSNEEKRASILQKIMPTIPFPRRPDLVAAYKYKMLDDSEKETYIQSRSHYLCPQLNIEVLCQDPKFLIDLLANRRSSAKALLPKLDGIDSDFRMLLDKESYGRIVVRNKDSDNHEGYKMNGKVCFGGVFDVSEGLCIMEAQQGLLEFLIGYCDEVLASMSSNQPAEGDIKPTEYDVQVHPVTPNWPEIGLDRTSSMFYGAPQLQMPTDFTKLATMCRTRYALAMDHAWLLRIDPGYFEENIEGVLQQDELNGSNITHVLSKAFLKLQQWKWLCDLASDAERLQKEYEKPRNYSQPVVSPPRDYFVAVLKLFQGLTACEKRMFDMVRDCDETAAVVRQFCIYSDPTLEEDEAGFKGLEQPEIMRLLNNMLAEKRSMWLFDFMDELEIEVMDKISEGRKVSANGKMFAPFLAHLLADLGLIGIAKYEVWRDWGQQIRNAKIEERCLILKDVFHKQETSILINRILGISKDKLYNLCSLENRFKHPVEAKRSENNDKSLRSAERAHDKFWQCVDKIMLGWGFPGFLKVTNMDTVFLRTPEWQAPKITTQESNITMPARVTSADNLNITLPTFIASDTPYVILVTERTMKVFTAIFQGASSNRNKTKKIHFNDFIKAMEEAGFRGTKHHVSMWHFHPEGVPLWADPALAHGIMINEPWPDQRISSKYAHQLGQRLHRHYGWHIETFTTKFNPDTHWIARFDAVEFLQGEKIGATQELGISTSEAALRNQQISRLQAEAGGYCVERKDRHPIWVGDICCSKIIELRTDDEVIIGHKSELGRRYPILFGNWA
ncbi:hypothetical protein DSL72_007053 [Monilinia vaccinii-corymbosi]|uniref:Uncharacterized protein n=1 Tax=Monilinia vaccinii-corymbosi TaxID=61207 RepID=A0A8A3PLY7_9HELO|nr:hypothetical protein DSL72_007053 [Monilinia vaccinii-corymbosi]